MSILVDCKTIKSCWLYDNECSADARMFVQQHTQSKATEANLASPQAAISKEESLRIIYLAISDHLWESSNPSVPLGHLLAATLDE